MSTFNADTIRNAYSSYINMARSRSKKKAWYTPEIYTDGTAAPTSLVDQPANPESEKYTAENIEKHVADLTPGSMLTINVTYPDGM